VSTILNYRVLKNLSRFRYAFDICLGTTFLWFLLRYLGDRNPVWAIISFIIVSDPSIEVARPAFLTRITHTLIGCIVGIVSIFIFGAVDWMLPIALTATALVCTLPIKRPSSWKLAPATAALVVASAIVHQSRLTALEEALRRTGEVALGSVTAVFLSWLFVRLWPKDASALARNDEKKV
jgi:uncharacterized membrane protein YgaE (UPF0421/DUF939 family)